MKFGPLVPATLARDAQGLSRTKACGEADRRQRDPLAWARSVFLAGNDLPRRWAGRDRFTVLGTAFGQGHSFLALWHAWRSDPQHCERLHVVWVEPHPLVQADLQTVHRNSPLPALAQALIDAWPPLSPDLHRLDFDDGRVQLSLCFGEHGDWLPELVCAADAFFLDGDITAWTPSRMKALGRLSSPDATAAAASCATSVREGLAAAGFMIELAPEAMDAGGILRARYAPRHRPQRPAGRSLTTRGPGTALIVGGGLAGAATAWALDRQGWRSTVLDRHAEPAREASGNPAGIFHGIVTPQDGPHARLGRAAATAARRAIGDAIAAGVPGAVDGLLRLETGLPDVAAITAAAARLGLPPSYVHAAEFDGRPAWRYAGGGWVSPPDLVRHWLAVARSGWQGGVEVDRLSREQGQWSAFDAGGRLLARADVVVLANAAQAQRLLGAPGWPVERRRGQLSIASASDWAAAGGVALSCPVSGSGYLLGLPDGRALFGATTQPGDEDPSVRVEDHRANLAQLAKLLGREPELDPARLGGRTAWRFGTDDRLPVVGGVPRRTTGVGTRLDQPRFVPREEDLFVFTALGSRGLTWAALGAQVVAAWIAGAPLPLGSTLLDAVDPARFVARARRRAAAAQAAGLSSAAP